jgi:hypothetical protein
MMKLAVSFLSFAKGPESGNRYRIKSRQNGYYIFMAKNVLILHVVTRLITVELDDLQSAPLSVPA